MATATQTSRSRLTPEEKRARRDGRRQTALVLALAAIRQATGAEAVLEHKFLPDRRFRFDVAWLDRKVAAEIDGAVWTGGRHTSGAGFIRDQEKLNLAGLAGWRVFRFTWKDVESGAFADVLTRALNG